MLLRLPESVSVLGNRLAIACACGAAQAQTNGPDVIVGAIPDCTDYASVGNIKPYAIGTTSCNVGNQVLNWSANTNQHPVIAQNIYLIENRRMRQIGMSWLKHGFATLNETLCGPCNPTNGQTLGVGCSDPYGSGLNGFQSGLGPRSEVNAANGLFRYPFGGQGASSSIDKRLQVNHADLASRGTYLVEAQYVAPDDALAGNNNNNSSVRRCTIGPAPGYQMTLSGQTIRETAALEAWPMFDPRVRLQTVHVPGDGRILVAINEILVFGGGSRWEIAVQNVTSDRSVGSIQVNLPLGSTVTNPQFFDVEYHTGEPYSGTPWQSTIDADGITWATESFATNPNANAIRWSTTYNFSFVSDQAPTNITLGFFKPGTPSFHVLPNPTNPDFDLSLATTGEADLAIGIENVPPQAAFGLTLLTLDTNTAQGAGPAFGVTPDILTALSQLGGIQPGNPMAWTWPTSGNFPDEHVELPQGIFFFATGLDLDAVGVAFSANGTMLDQTPVRRIRL